MKLHADQSCFFESQSRPLAPRFSHDKTNRESQSEVRRLPFEVYDNFNFSNASLILFMQLKE